MADILESIEKSEDDISVKLKIIDLKKDHLENYQKGINEEKIPDWTALERAELTKLKGDGIVQVLIGSVSLLFLTLCYTWPK